MSQHVLWKTAALFLVGLQLTLGALHDAAHDRLGIVNPGWFDALLLAAVLVGPLAGIGLIFTRRDRSGWTLIFVTAVVAAGASILGHYVVVSPDNVRQLPEADGAGIFRQTAALLLTVQVGLAALSAARLLIWAQGRQDIETRQIQADTRLAPVVQPRSLWMQAIYRLVRSSLGMVPTPVQVILPRQAAVMGVNRHVASVADRKIGLPFEEANLIRAYASKLNGCAFCQDLALAQEIRKDLGSGRFDALADPEASNRLTVREKAALRIVRHYAEHRDVDDETWAQAAALFDERELIEILWLNAAEQYFNAINNPLRIGSDGLAARAWRHGSLT